MNLKFASAIAAGLVTVAGAGISPASAIPFLVDFENTPSLSTGPSIYVAVPGPQTITTTPATFTGGVILGFATFFPAISFATAPNVYGTADFGNGLPELLTIAINPAFTTTEVSFALFNGETFNQSYTVNAFNGASLVANQTLTNVAPNFNSGYGLVDLVASNITSVTIVPTGAPAAWDFLIDTVAFNQNITSIVPPPVVQPATPPVDAKRILHGHGHEGEVELLDSVEINFGDDINDVKGSFLVVTPSITPSVPEPGTYAMMLAGLGLMGFVALQRKQKSA